PGGGNNWDFSGLSGSEVFILTSIDPAASPFINEFPGATITTFVVKDFQGDPAQIWFYSNLNNGLNNMGNAAVIDSTQGTVFTTKHNPAVLEFQLPLTYNSSWTQSFTSTFYLNGTPFISNSFSLSTVVDAYGTMTLPGGSSFEALRVRESTTVLGETDVYYLFVSKSGAQVSLFASDPNPPLSGTIALEGYSYNGPFTVTSVEHFAVTPDEYYLAQNYPNPFNPSTVISWQSPNGSWQTLKVYDLMGREVATLVDEFKSAGNYEVNFDASKLSSGTYFYTLQAGNFSQTKKLILIK
ncbi:MAG TPA: T9SS type A sorting domain-containing protein, partial [Ignavibacteriaceae bacterium]|nr:T9SS type A sorting domain-containing protein [Ignavibacteriaceae bacterium]